jgi:AcrR family transcriptional regulator
VSTSKSASYHHGDLRAALVSAALQLLEESDVETISLRAVARRAGVSAMAPYRHYPDKEALLAAVAQAGFDGLRAALTLADSTATADKALLAQGVAYVRYAMANPVLFRLMFGPPRRGKHVDLRTSSQTAFGVLVQRVARQTAPAERQARVLGYWSLVHGLAMLILDDQTPVAGVTSPDAITIERILSSTLRFD